MNQTIKELLERKSVRVFEEHPIEEEKKQLILEAALQAPTAGNMTLYTIIDVQDQKIKDQLAQTCDHQPFIAKAPLVLIFVADYQKWYDAFKCYHPESEIRTPSHGDLLLACSDAIIAAQNAVVAAESLGIGSCYIGDIIEQYETHKELLNIPQYALPVAMLVMGYPTSQQSSRHKPARFSMQHIVSTDQYQTFDESKIIEMFEQKAFNTNHPKGGKGVVDGVYFNKWTKPFIEEMTRSTQLWLKQWDKKK